MFAQGGANLFLKFGRSLRQAIVFPCGEALRGGKTDLIENVVPGVGFETARPRGEFQAEPLGRRVFSRTLGLRPVSDGQGTGEGYATE